MTILHFPLPANLHGDLLEAELAANDISGSVFVEDDHLCVVTDAADPLVAAVVAAHDPAPPTPPPPLEARVAALEETVEQLASGGL